MSVQAGEQDGQLHCSRQKQECGCLLKGKGREGRRPPLPGPSLQEEERAEDPDCSGPSNQTLVTVVRPAFWFPGVWAWCLGKGWLEGGPFHRSPLIAL